MSELKPCPFCGGEAQRKQIKPYRKIKGRGQSYSATVGCIKWDCGADVSRAGFDIETSWQYAEDFWNRRADGWIPVQEGLPESSGIFLCSFTEGEKVYVERFYFNSFSGWLMPVDWNKEGVIEKITHWMPLPEPPGGVKRDE